jgi:hypothetical protein
MTISTSAPAAIELTHRRLAGLLATVTAATAALTWALTTVAIDTTAEHTRPTATRSQLAIENPLGAAIAAAPLVSARAEPIVVADAYHGVGFTLCPNGTELTTVADSYHGAGVTVCS